MFNWDVKFYTIWNIPLWICIYIISMFLLDWYSLCYSRISYKQENVVRKIKTDYINNFYEAVIPLKGSYCFFYSLSDGVRLPQAWITGYSDGYTTLNSLWTKAFGQIICRLNLFWFYAWYPTWYPAHRHGFFKKLFVQHSFPLEDKKTIKRLYRKINLEYRSWNGRSCRWTNNFRKLLLWPQHGSRKG